MLNVKLTFCYTMRVMDPFIAPHASFYPHHVIVSSFMPWRLAVCLNMVKTNTVNLPLHVRRQPLQKTTSRRDKGQNFIIGRAETFIAYWQVARDITHMTSSASRVGPYCSLCTCSSFKFYLPKATLHASDDSSHTCWVLSCRKNMLQNF